eukprot:scaffold1342_cov204-Pinguiococcus_pyrenoidosus.AAC.17
MPGRAQLARICSTFAEVSCAARGACETLVPLARWEPGGSIAVRAIRTFGRAAQTFPRAIGAFRAVVTLAVVGIGIRSPLAGNARSIRPAELVPRRDATGVARKAAFCAAQQNPVGVRPVGAAFARDSLGRCPRAEGAYVAEGLGGTGLLVSRLAVDAGGLPRFVLVRARTAGYLEAPLTAGSGGAQRASCRAVRRHRVIDECCDIDVAAVRADRDIACTFQAVDILTVTVSPILDNIDEA